jgi:hypothetical protein
MEPITLLQMQDFERRLAGAPLPPQRRHAAELRQRRAEVRKRQLVSLARSLAPAGRRRATTLEPCGC